MSTRLESPAGAAPSAVPPGDPVRLVRRHRLSRWDVKLSPYLYISPFFILFGLIGVFPLIYTGYLSLCTTGTVCTTSAASTSASRTTGSC